MQVTITTEADKLNVVIHGEIDHHSVTELRDSVDGQILQSRPQTIRLDFSGVTFMDSSGIAVVVQSARQMRALGGDMAVSGVSKQAMRVFSAAGIPKLVRFTEGGENR